MYTLLYWDIIIGDLYLKYCFIVEHEVIDKPLSLSSLPPPSLPPSIFTCLSPLPPFVHLSLFPLPLFSSLPLRCSSSELCSCTANKPPNSCPLHGNGSQRSHSLPVHISHPNNGHKQTKNCLLMQCLCLPVSALYYIVHKSSQ